MSRTILALALATVLASAALARAQGRPYAERPIEVNAHIGGFALDGGDTETMFGVRGTFHTRRGIGVGASLDLVSVEDAGARFGTLGFEGDLRLVSGHVSYAFPSGGPVHFFATAGVGAATFSPDEGDDRSELLIPVGGGFAWTREGSRWAVRADVRDQIIRVGDGESDTFHNWEFSGGISFLFGL